MGACFRPLPRTLRGSSNIGSTLGRLLNSSYLLPELRWLIAWSDGKNVRLVGMRI